MSDELDKLRETIKRSKKVIEEIRAVLPSEELPLTEKDQTEKGERNQTVKPPQSE